MPSKGNIDANKINHHLQVMQDAGEILQLRDELASVVDCHNQLQLCKNVDVESIDVLRQTLIDEVVL